MIKCYYAPKITSSINLVDPDLGSWSYGTHYWDLVIDFLNCDYESIGADGATTQEYMDRIKRTNPKLYCWYKEPGVLLRKKIKAIKKDLGVIDVCGMRKLVDAIFVDDRFPELSVSTKYFSFVHSLSFGDNEYGYLYFSPKGVKYSTFAVD